MSVTESPAVPRFAPADTRVSVRRVIARIVDSVVLVSPWFVLAVISRELAGWVLFASFFAYFGALQGATGWTLGKLLVGIRVVDRAGAPPGVVAAIKRSLPLLVQALGIVALAFMLSSPWRQRAGDRWANTYVVRGAALS